MKKLLSIVIAFIFMMTMLAACGDPANEPTGTQPEVNQPAGGDDGEQSNANESTDGENSDGTPDNDIQITEPEATEPEVTEPEPVIDDVSYSLVDGTLTISGTGSMEDYTLTSFFDSTTDSPWNSQRETITSIVIEQGVTHIGDFAFYGCSNLTSVTIADSVTSIGIWAFYGCGMFTGIENIGIESIVLPDSVTSIGESAFATCTNLTSITIPASVTSIGSGAFNGCRNLTSITIPASVTSMDSALYGSSITDIYYGGTQEQWEALTDGVDIWRLDLGDGQFYGDIPSDLTIHYES